MPTFDFSNIIRKIVQGAISISCSPMVIIFAVSTLLVTIWRENFSFFNDFELFSVDFSFPTYDSVTGQFFSLFLYAVHFDQVIDFVDSVTTIVNSLFVFFIQFISSLVVVLASVLSYRAIRSALRDWL